jgi:hypothetical protein
MKQERIEELLKGTKYEIKPDKDPEWSYDTQHGYACAECSAPWLAKTCSDMVLNAARVQLLAKALRQCMVWMESTRQSGDAGFWDWSEGDEYTEAKAALKEAGIKE